MHIFREKALQRLSSPEQLDRLFRVTDSIGWLALVVCIVLVMLALAWSVFGSIPVQVSGSGILLHAGGRIVIVSAPGEGRLVSYSVAVQDPVASGQLVATLTEPHVEQELLLLRNERDNLLAHWRRIHERYHRMMFRMRNLQDARREALEQQLRVSRKSLTAMEELEEGQKKLAEKRIANTMAVEDTRAKLLGIKQRIADVQSEISQLDLTMLEREHEFRENLDAADGRIRSIEQEIDQARLRWRQGTSTLSPVQGTVVGLLATPGALAQKGNGLVSISAGESRIELLLYVPAGPAKQIEPGEPVRFSPAAISREELGYMMGSGASISPLPVTRTEMLNDIGDETLVNQLSADGAPIAVRVRFDTDPDSASGIRWSSRRGAQLSVTTGTLGTADVTVREDRPIELLIPTLRRWVGV
jgi:HlyD family secretion protein